MTATPNFTPTPISTPIWPGRCIAGSFFDFFRDPIGTFTRAVEQCGDTVRFEVFHETVIFFRHPEAIRRVFKDNCANYSRERNLEVARFKALLGSGILTTDGDRWVRYRRASQPAFGRRFLAIAGERMTATAAQVLDGWAGRSGQGPFDVFPELMVLTVSTSIRALFGAQLEASAARRVVRALTDGQRYIYDTMGLPFALPRFIPTPGNRRFNRATRDLAAVMRSAVADRRARVDEGDDLLAMLLRFRDEGGAALGERELQDQMLTALVAAPENTSSTLSWALYLLARHPAVESRLREEVAAVLGGRAPTALDLPRLAYTSAVIAEVLRLYPGAWSFDRRALGDDVVCGHAVPRGALVFVSPYLTHRHPEFWADPERFVPERFLDGGRAEGRAGYMPFGLGPRQCVGDRFARMTLELVLPMLLQRFRFRLEGDRVVAPLPLVTLRPAGGMPLALARA